jgi:hypothetical protein
MAYSRLTLKEREKLFVSFIALLTIVCSVNMVKLYFLKKGFAEMLIAMRICIG